MKVLAKDIRSVGLTTLYHPDNSCDAVVDVVLVHGIGGHPVRSWKWVGKPDPPLTPKSAKSTNTGSFRRLLRRDPLLRRSNSEPLLVLGTKTDSSGRSRNVLRKNSLKSSSRLRLETGDGVLGKGREPEVYWPLELLPRSCPNARILVWGYHTLVADGQPLRLQSDVFGHAKELLLDLVDAREATNTSHRPIIFVAHSTGGILVKEVLRLSEAEGDGPLRSIIMSTSATIFLGSPHRSSEHARLGDAVRSMASLTLGVDSRDPVLWELSGSASAELERGREAFIRLWDDYNFRVKTFQESITTNTRLLELRAEAAVRRLASLIGNPTESAETICASHLDMCRFSSADDNGYRALANTLARYVRLEGNRRNAITDRELACLTALARPRFPIHDTGRHSTSTYPGTCLWLYDLPEFQAWHHRSDGNKNKILWIKGQSGSGKSTLLRSLRSRIERQWTPAGGRIISAKAGGRDLDSVFFPGSYAQHVGTDPSAVYRSILAQLFLQDPHLRKAMVALYERQPTPCQTLDDSTVVSFFVDDYIDQRIETPARRTFIFVDVSDDCGPSYLQELLSQLPRLARNSDFSICVASPNLPSITQESAIDILIQHRNTDDILRYINVNLVAEWEERNSTVLHIGQKASGVFLWAEIVVNILNAAIGEGASQDLIEYTLDEMPGDLHGLYEWMLNTLNDHEKEEALILFQWAILSAEPMGLRLNDLLVAVRLTRTWSYAEFRPYMALDLPPPTSMRDIRQIRNSEVRTDNPHQLNRWIRSRSIGLLTLRPDTQSDIPIPTSPFGLQRVTVTHDSVRTFFISGRGFAILTTDPTARYLSPADLIDQAHYSLLHACLTYLNMRDFEPLVSHPSISSPMSPTASQQRQLITASYPFLQYAVHHTLYHLLSPKYFRYFLPQTVLLRMFAADGCRLWRRWTALLGSPDVLGVSGEGSAGGLLSPVFGARFRLERVFRRLGRMVGEGRNVGGKKAEGEGGFGVTSPGLRLGEKLRSPRKKDEEEMSGKTLWSPGSGSAWSPGSSKGKAEESSGASGGMGKWSPHVVKSDLGSLDGGDVGVVR